MKGEGYLASRNLFGSLDNILKEKNDQRRNVLRKQRGWHGLRSWRREAFCRTQSVTSWAFPEGICRLSMCAVDQAPA